MDWLPVFHTAACGDILAGSLDFCRREKGLRLYAWVIMENHFHAVVQADDLPRVMADLKKFTAGQLLAQLEAERRTWLLDLLAVGKAAHKIRRSYQLWQKGYHPQAIYSDQTMLQKIDYIHANPVRRGWVEFGNGVPTVGSAVTDFFPWQLSIGPPAQRPSASPRLQEKLFRRRALHRASPSPRAAADVSKRDARRRGWWSG